MPTQEQDNVGPAGNNATVQYSSGDKQIISVTDLISEGPIQGLVDAQASVFLNDDRVAPLSQAASTYSQSSATIQLTQNSPTATITGAGTTPVIEATNGDKYLIVRAVHSGYVTASNGSTSDANGNITATVTTNGSTSLFTTNMISVTSETFDTIVPVGLRPIGPGRTSDPWLEGTLISRASQSVAEFMPGITSPEGLWIPDGAYFITIDRVVKIASISGAVLTLASNWPYPTVGRCSIL